MGIGYATTQFRWGESNGKGRIEKVFGGLYGRYRAPHFSLSLATIAGDNFYRTDRSIHIETPGHPGGSLYRTASSHSSGFQWSNHLGLNRKISRFKLPLEIFGNLDHFYLYQNSFREVGAESLNLRVNRKVSNFLKSEIGLMLSHTFCLKGSSFTPYGQLSYVNKTPLSSSLYRGGFVGKNGTLSVSSTSHSLNEWAPELGVQCANEKGFSLSLSLRGELNGGDKNIFSNLKLAYRF